MNKQTLSRNERADDIARLKADLNLPHLDYLDISAQLELSQALKRWPLLADLASLGSAQADSAEPVQPTQAQPREARR